LNTFEKLAKVSKSYNVLRYIEEIKNEQKNWIYKSCRK
jgi:ribosomal protein S15P/S13E